MARATPLLGPAAADPASGPHGASDPHAIHGRFWGLAIGSIGVVFGDIGTSPLYAFKLALAESGDHVRAPAVLGVLSLALWALILVVTVKYVLFLMRADNRGEGGVMSLAALAQSALGARTRWIFFLALAGAALFYGDAAITPAISVLSAVEGLRSVPALSAHVTLPIVLITSLVILVGLFAAQARGTAGVAKLFGPIMVFWFLCIGGLGLMHLVQEPQVLAALSPHYGLMFILEHKLIGFLVLGSVFLTVTGGEALYADMGHFGRWPIQASWLFLCLPMLAVNYLGQGALAMHAIKAAAGAPVNNDDWFFLLAPEVLRAPLVLLSTIATVIASQAVITGAFSLTNSAMQLGWLPRMVVRRTSETEAGQIFLPQVNLILAVAVVMLIAIFKSSDALAHAYGLAVTGTMAVTTTLAFTVVRRCWKWRLAPTLAVIAPLLTIDLVFLSANLLKLLSGGFVPLVIGGAVFLLMSTWVRGVEMLNEKTQREQPTIEDLLPALQSSSAFRIPGTAIFLTSDLNRVPGSLLHNLKHNHVLHRKNIIVSVETADEPRVADAHRLSVRKLSDDFIQVKLTFGYMETPNVPRALTTLRRQGVKFDIMTTSFFLGRRTVVRGARSAMPRPLDQLFIWMMKNAANPTEFFRIPPGRVVEMGTQVTL
jgi:KUP system potassium uptake protein